MVDTKNKDSYRILDRLPNIHYCESVDEDEGRGNVGAGVQTVYV